MSTHKKLTAALEASLAAHRNAHVDSLAAAGLQDYAEATVSPLGPPGDMQGAPEADNG